MGQKRKKKRIRWKT